MSTPRTAASPGALERYLAHLRNERRLSPHTLAAYRRDAGLLLALAGERALEKLGTAGVRKLLLEGGGEMNGSFVRAGLVDELSLLFTPVVDGGPGEPALFDVEDERLDEALTGLRLEHVSRVAADMLWVRYTVKNRRRRV